MVKLATVSGPSTWLMNRTHANDPVLISVGALDEVRVTHTLGAGSSGEDWVPAVEVSERRL